jgi:DNA-directed RNA polymerase specialized sigma24 family protein
LVRIYRDYQIRQAFGALVRRYETQLFRLIDGIVGDRTLAEKLCARAFVRSALTIDQLSEEHSYYSWAVRAARETIAEQQRLHDSTQ